MPIICAGSIVLTERISQTRRNLREEGIFTVLNTLENADLLILDDLGIEEDNRWTRTMTYQIIEKRNASKLPVIITTNISLSELKERYDERTFSRLVKMCSFIENEGEDIRKIQGKEENKRFMQEIL